MPLLKNTNRAKAVTMLADGKSLRTYFSLLSLAGSHLGTLTQLVRN
jgi:hypothetical protein